MDHSKRLRAQVYTYIASALVLVGVFSIITWYVLFELIRIDSFLAIIISFIALIGFSLLLSEFVLKAVLEPLNTLVRAIMHVAPGHEHSASSPPNLEAIRTGRELINNMVLLVYELASHGSSQTAKDSSHRKELMQAINIVNHLPLPMLVLNNERVITNASESAITYLGTETSKLFGQTLEDTIRLTFPSEHTLSRWMEECQKNKVTTTGFWERVRVTLPDQTEKQCDLSAHYSRDNPSGADFIITMFDRTDHYQQDDDSLNFVAMAVHE
ncbi:MAG: PAS domain-containing protein, partial [Actinobacteria bacterium]|nr:PAS domain-containing protein [Actinomycetota bacterium]